MMDYNLFQALSIAIIGGADGPTSIYISTPNLIFMVISAVLKLCVLGVLIFFLVKAIKEKNRKKIIIFAIILVGLMLLFTLPALINAITIFKYNQILQKNQLLTQ